MTEPKRDQWGRYLLPHPDTGIEQAWTRATTIANTLSDRFKLENWNIRNTVWGVGHREDLYALTASVATTDDEGDKALLTRIAHQAQEAAHASSSANLGTALHRLTERIDRGEILDVPEAWRADIDSYCQSLADHSIKILPELIERVVVVPQIGAAGTFDRLVEVNGELMVADLKTGAHAITYGVNEIAIQLAIYARATHMVLRDEDVDHAEGSTNWYQSMPEVSQDKALIIHLPVGTGTCTLHTVDITMGWFGVELAMQVRDWRSRKDLAAPLSQWRLQAVPDQPTGTDDW